ncbi:hypothetical protein [Alkalibacterium thalassium]|uniref:DUF4352 domain-containing protein n=1 Tax=Alkalibacterium thalassium TaxID=426701 RepID=A0A1G8X7Z6_9LACT|nr:hypothetical protein [Alkalibacterium thalassium]SDJ86778.1 hypothetical protein SAMN04488098_10066 [Alkalibacterium thalassium]
MEMKKLLALISASAFLLAACDDVDTPADDDDSAAVEDDTEAEVTETEEVEEEADTEEETAEAEEEPEDSELLSIGESITIDDITMTITNAEFTDERNQFEEDEPEHVIAIYYTLENDTDDDYGYGMDFDVYVDGSQADTYPNDNSMGSVSSGRSTDGVAHYAVNGETIEVEWEPLFSFSGEKGIWDVTP